MTPRERELTVALEQIAKSGDPKSALLARCILGKATKTVLRRSGFIGEIDHGLDEIESRLGRGTTSADLQRYRDALACHHHYRLIPLGFENRWSTVTG